MLNYYEQLGDTSFLKTKDRWVEICSRQISVAMTKVIFFPKQNSERRDEAHPENSWRNKRG